LDKMNSVSEEIQYLTTEEAAEILRMNPNTLRHLRNKGGGPPFYRRKRLDDDENGRVFYKREDLHKWFVRYDQNFEPREKR